MTAAYALTDAAAPELHDSGYTTAALESIFAGLAKGVTYADDDEPLALAMALGVADGDVLEMSDSSTVMLSTPRAELDRRVEAVRERMRAGSTFPEAVESVVG
jgi:hypothetical protein